MNSGDSSDLYTDICNVCPVLLSLGKQALLMVWENTCSSLSEADLYKSPLKMTVGLMLLLVDQSCVSGDQETIGKFFLVSSVLLKVISRTSIHMCRFSVGKYILLS